MIVQNMSERRHHRHLLHRAQADLSVAERDRAPSVAEEIGAAGVIDDADIAQVSARRRRA